MIKRNLKYNHVYDNMLKFLTNLIPKKQLKKFITIMDMMVIIINVRDKTDNNT